MATFFHKLRLTLEMIKFEHSVFALPFALTGALLAFREDGFATTGLAWKIAWIVIAMVSARSAAMAFNRVIDAPFDSRNPRTAMRHLPAGTLSLGFAWMFVVGAALLFVFAAAMLNRLCLQLSPLALAVVLLYSYTKRFTSLSHVVLGFALGIAPAAAWIAMRASLDVRILWLTAAVTLWTAGFDIIYSCQDYDFDRRTTLFSLPKTLGIPRALMLARAFHIGMILCLLMLVWSFSLHGLAWAGIAAVAMLLLWEHSLVKANDLTRIDAAFFTVNGYVSVLFFFFWTADILFFRASAF
jgi:4-hydroxybenzoate polyprenyltransferase